MGNDQLEAVRGAVRALAGDRVMAFAAPTVGANLGLTEDRATELLMELQREHLVEARGFVQCPHCGATKRLEGRLLNHMRDGALGLADRPCEECGHLYPARGEIEVRLGFFSQPSASRHASKGKAEAPALGPSPELGSPLTVAHLDQIAKGVGVTINAGDKSQITVGSQVGNTIGGDNAGRDLNKPGRDMHAGNGGGNSDSAGHRGSLWKNPLVIVAIIGAISAIAVAVITASMGEKKSAGSPPAAKNP